MGREIEKTILHGGEIWEKRRTDKDVKEEARKARVLGEETKNDRGKMGVCCRREETGGYLKRGIYEFQAKKGKKGENRAPDRDVPASSRTGSRSEGVKNNEGRKPSDGEENSLVLVTRGLREKVPSKRRPVSQKRGEGRKQEISLRRRQKGREKKNVTCRKQPRAGKQRRGQQEPIE